MHFRVLIVLKTTTMENINATSKVIITNIPPEPVIRKVMAKAIARQKIKFNNDFMTYSAATGELTFFAISAKASAFVAKEDFPLGESISLCAITSDIISFTSSGVT